MNPELKVFIFHVEKEKRVFGVVSFIHLLDYLFYFFKTFSVTFRLFEKLYFLLGWLALFHVFVRTLDLFNSKDKCQILLKDFVVRKFMFFDIFPFIQDSICFFDFIYELVQPFNFKWIFQSFKKSCSNFLELIFFRFLHQEHWYFVFQVRVSLQ